jgi:5-(carboxyamino)imidazole ribonucleotide mutase
VTLQGLDALLSTVQMPAGIPVASVAIGKAGARNAAYLAAQILALSDKKLAARLVADRVANAEGVAEKDRALQERLKSL